MHPDGFFHLFLETGVADELAGVVSLDYDQLACTFVDGFQHLEPLVRCKPFEYVEQVLKSLPKDHFLSGLFGLRTRCLFGPEKVFESRRR